MTNVAASAVAANLADTFASRDGLIDLTPRIKAAADVCAWLNDSPDAFLEDYRPGWQDDSYIPTEADWAEYAAWCRSLDGGCRVDELTPEERDLLTHSLEEAAYWRAVAELDERFAEYDAARDCEDAFADLDAW